MKLFPGHRPEEATRPLPEGGTIHRGAFLRSLAAALGAVGLGGSAGVLDRLAAPLQAAAAAPGLWLGNVRGLARNKALSYTDPKSGDPAVFLHLANGRFVSYDAVCTHEGCTVPYNAKRGLLVCPCHGATYDPAHGARVISGPAPSPLRRLPVQVDAQGNVYALDAKPTKVKPPARLHAGLPTGTSNRGGDDPGGDDGSRTKRNRPPRKGGGDD